MKRLFKAFLNSYHGLLSTFNTETAFRQELVLCALLLPLLVWLDRSLLAKAMMLASLLLVLMMELANSAIEAIIDRISKEYHLLSKQAKDIGSAMVLLAIINAIAVWTLCLLTP